MKTSPATPLFFEFIFLYYMLLHKELGVVDKYYDLYVNVTKRMLPSFLGTAFKVLKATSPSRAFKQVTDQLAYIWQVTMPLSNIELIRISDREVTMRSKNCPMLKRMRDLVKKAASRSTHKPFARWMQDFFEN